MSRNVKFARINPGHFGPKGWRPARLVALVDDYVVTCTGNGKGWSCKCTDPECDHLNAVADLLDREVLDELEAEDDYHLREQRRPMRPRTPRPTVQRRRRLPREEQHG